MTPTARTAATIEILDDIIRLPKPADSIMSAYFRARRFIGSKDRTAIASAAYRALRRFLRLEWHLARAGAKLNGRNLVLAELLLAENLSAQDIAEIFSGQQYAPRKLTVDEQYMLTRLRNVLPLKGGGGTRSVTEGVKKDLAILECEDMPLNIRLECPAEYVEKFQTVFGENFELEMRGMMTEAPLDLRVNPQVIERDAAIQELKQNHITAAATPFSPFGIRVVGRPALPTLDLFRRGGVEIQDEGSQLIALLLGAQPGEQVVDFCAGAGGKTLAIAAQMNNKGRVVACDVLDKRLTRGRVRFTRAGLDNIQTRPLTNENDKWVKRSAGAFDRVLVDAPCSGTGVWRRNPDGRWKHLGPGLDELLPLQESILNSAARLVKPGGRLGYATCSLLPDENQMQIEKFLAAHADFKLVPVQTVAQDLNLPDTGDYMQLTPARHQTDGFFAAVLARN